MSSRRYVFVRAVALVCCGAAFMVGCSTTGTERAAKAAESLQEVQAQIEKASGQLDTTLAALNDLVDNPKADLKPQYDTFTTAIDELEAQVVTIRNRSNAMKARREEYFKGWEADAMDIANPDLKQYSEDRKAALRAEYEKITQQAETLRSVSDPLLKALRDIQQLLSLDLTADGLKSVADPVKKVNEDAKAVKSEVEKFLAELDTVAKLLSRPAAEPKGS